MVSEFMRLGLGPKSHVLFVNMSAKVKSCFITKENQVQKVMVVNLPTNALTKYKPLCLIRSSLSLQNLYFVRKHVKILVHYPHNNKCPGQISLLRQTSCGFPWGHCQMFSHIVHVRISPRRPRSTSEILHSYLEYFQFP